MMVSGFADGTPFGSARTASALGDVGNQRRQSADRLQHESRLADGFAAGGFGNDRAREAELFCLLEPRRGLGHRPDCAGKRDFAEINCISRQRRVRERGDQRRRGGKVGGRFLDTQPTGNVEVDVVARELDATMGL